MNGNSENLIQKEHGQDKCPKCGATDITLNTNNGNLRCNFCRYEFQPIITNNNEDIFELNTEIISSGSDKIDNDSNDLITLKCQSCGSEVVIESKQAYQSRCHWCRNILSINHQIPNGTIPDKVLPFKISKNQAQNIIKNFVNKRKFFALKKFKQEFNTDNIMGVYFPYMLVDINANAQFSGRGEHTIRTYSEEVDKQVTTYHDISIYQVDRNFDIAISDLSIESNTRRLKKHTNQETNNIINAIMPFDTENCVEWNANYIRGFTSEKRDIDVEQLSNTINNQARNLAKFQINHTLEHYDRGVYWKNQEFEIKGRRWEAAYLPVWLYSYQQKNKLIHYVAVNARTQEVMGSIPVSHTKLFFVSLIVEILSLFLANILEKIIESPLAYLLLLSGLIFYYLIYNLYRNVDARHNYEQDTKFKINNLEKQDIHLKDEFRVRSSRTENANNDRIDDDNGIYNIVINSAKNILNDKNDIFKL